MSAAEVDAHNIAGLWTDALAHVDAARNALDNAVVALEDLATTYGVERAGPLGDDASRAFDTVEQLHTDVRHSKS
jgi:hypothetical protein